MYTENVCTKFLENVKTLTRLDSIAFFIAANLQISDLTGSAVHSDYSFVACYYKKYIPISGANYLPYIEKDF
jgi:hypothetical protein